MNHMSQLSGMNTGYIHDIFMGKNLAQKKENFSRKLSQRFFAVFRVFLWVLENFKKFEKVVILMFFSCF